MKKLATLYTAFRIVLARIILRGINVVFVEEESFNTAIKRCAALWQYSKRSGYLTHQHKAGRKVQDGTALIYGLLQLSERYVREFPNVPKRAEIVTLTSAIKRRAKPRLLEHGVEVEIDYLDEAAGTTLGDQQERLDSEQAIRSLPQSKRSA